MGQDHQYFSQGLDENMPRAFSKAGRCILRVGLLFGSAALALGLIIIPILNDQANRKAAQSILPDNIDRTMTGSIKRTAP